MKSGDQNRGASNREALGTIIAERLELEEEWYPHDRFSYFSGKIKNLRNFEGAFRRVLEVGCRWDVMLTCFARVLSYNLEKVPQQLRTLSPSAQREPRPLVIQDSKGNWYPEDTEDPLALRPSYRPKIMPPAAEERERLRADLQAASNGLKRYDTLLYELSAYLPFQNTGFGPEITSVDAWVLLPRLLRWSERLLTEQSLGNARTIERAGELVPCVYVELLAAQQKTRSAREILPWLGAVAETLNELEWGKVPSSRATKKKPSKPRLLSDSQLAEALRRFKRGYPDVYHQLRRKLTDLHDQPRPELGDWHQAYVRDIAGQRPRRS
jgi:hypothetical protein